MTIFWLLRLNLLFLILLPQMGLAGTSSSTELDRKVSYISASSAPSLTFEQLSAAVLSESLESVEEVLEWISKHHPAYLQNFTLMRRSGSAQGANGEYPRAIVYGSDASFIMTFNGHPSQKGYDRLEMIQFRDATASFEFREIVFPKHQNTPLTDSKPIISEANPGSCLQCHGSNRRPLWDPYETWHGAYGERDDVIKDFSQIEDLSPTDARRRYSEEFADFQTFLTLKNHHNRYRWLQSLSTSHVAPYSSVERSPDYNSRPNLKLTKLLTLHRAKQIVHGMQGANPCDRMTQNLVLAYTMSCSFGHKAHPILKDLERQIVHATHATELRSYANNAARLYQLLSLRGWEASDWSLVQFPKNWGYFTGSQMLRDHVAQLLFGQVAMRLAEIRGFPGYMSDYRFISLSSDGLAATTYEGYRGEGREKYRMPEHVRNSNHEADADRVCVALIKEAQNHFRKLTSVNQCFMPFDESLSKPTESDAAGVADVVRMCASCHTDQSEEPAPFIDFYDRSSILDDAYLKAAIRKRISIINESGMMPPTRSLTERERQTLIQYFDLKP